MGGNSHSEIIKEKDVKRKVMELLNEYFEENPKFPNPMYIHSLTLEWIGKDEYKLSRYITV